jgi:hypothetical protein
MDTVVKCVFHNLCKKYIKFNTEIEDTNANIDEICISCISKVFDLKPGKNFEIEHEDLQTSFGPIFCGCETATVGINSLQAKSTVPICDSCINKFVEYWNEI